jgi:hypothetical protein
VSGPVPSIRNVALLQRALADVRDHGAPRIAASSITERADGRLAVKVFPANVWDRALFFGFEAEVWQQPGVTRANLAENQASHLRHPDRTGKCALVLGAGNQSSIPVMDALQKLIVEGQVVLLKMNPVNEYLGPVFKKVFAPLIEKGWFEVVYGGGDVGAYLCRHTGIDNIHITGSDQTHDMIVWGPKEGREGRKQRGEKALDKEITSELGNVTPIIVVPGKWSDRDLAFQAENIASMVSNNASFNCIAGKLVVVAREWEQKDAFIEAVRRALAAIPPRKAYYPGARDRWQQFLKAHPNAEKLGPDVEGTVPWTLITGLDPAADDEICFSVEPFCGVLHEVALPGRTAVEFLPRAVEFCNAKVWGTLGITVIVHPSTRNEPASEAAFQEALDDLKYGTIVVNHWAGLGYGLVNTTWGAYPGHPLEDIQSGRGVVHNTYLFDKPEKSVVYGPFIPMTKPVWFWSHRSVHKLAPPLVKFQAHPSLWRLLKVAPYAIG